MRLSQCPGKAPILGSKTAFISSPISTGTQDALTRSEKLDSAEELARDVPPEADIRQRIT